MNSVLYHLHPVKVKRHAVKVSYTLCLGGLSFFLFILLTVTGIFLMFFYRTTAAQAWDDIYTLQTSVTFGLLVRNMHRWAARAEERRVGKECVGKSSIGGAESYQQQKHTIKRKK